MNPTTRKLIAIFSLTLAVGLTFDTRLFASVDDIIPGYFNGEFALGYRNVWLDMDRSRALEYASQQNGATGKLLLDAGLEQKRLYLSGDFLNDQDYRGDLDIDINGLVRLELATDKMVHNLPHIPYDTRIAPPNDQLYAGQNGYLTFNDLQPQDQYQIEVNNNSAHARFKHPGYPAHLNLNFKRQEKTGHQQLRFVDEGNGNLNGNGNCSKCHMQSTTRVVDWNTDEFSAGIDAHIGPVDVVVEQLHREFRDRGGIPTDLFGTHNYRDLAEGPTVHQHDEAPDSQLNQTTLKLHTSLAGGVVGAASASFGSMESQSQLTDVGPADAKADFYQLAGDATYIINPRWTVNFRYRMSDIDNQLPAEIVDPGVLPANGPLPVRDSVDLTRSSYEARVSYRPSRAYTVKGEYRYLDIERGNTGGPVDFKVSGGLIVQPDLSWELPDQETRQRFRLDLTARPLANRKLQLKGHYHYETSSDPAYGTSVEDHHELYGGATWTANRWGVNGSVRYTNEQNDARQLFLPDGSANPFPFYSFNLNRDREVTNLVVGAWLMPSEKISLNANYGYLQTAIRQDLVFGGQPSVSGPGDPANYAIYDNRVPFDQSVHTATAMLDWRLLDNLGCTLEGRYIKSKSAFDPNFPLTTLDFSGNLVDLTSVGLKQISAVDITQLGMTFGVNWQLQQSWACSASYSYDDLQDDSALGLNGMAQSIMTSLSYIW